MLVYSVLEGVAFALLEGYLALQSVGTIVTSTSLVGGGSKSRFWCELLASALNLPLSLHTGGEHAAALGAARLGLLAANPGTAIGDVCAPPPLIGAIEPQPAWNRQLAPRFDVFRRTYAALRPVFST